MIGIMSFVVCCAGVGFFIALFLFVGSILGKNDKKSISQKGMAICFVVFWGLGLTIGALYDPPVSEDASNSLPVESVPSAPEEKPPAEFSSSASEVVPEIEAVPSAPDVAVEEEPVLAEPPEIEELPMEEEPASSGLLSSEMEAMAQVDSDILLIVEQAESYFSVLGEGFVLVSEGKGTAAELYLLSQSVYDRQQECYKLLALYKSDFDCAALKNSAMSYVRNFSVASENAMEFLESGSVSAQAKYLECMEWREALVVDYTEKRIGFFLSQGVAEEEVWALLGAVD